jgi:GNAT superfamily N-acetyltransferase
MPIEIRKAEIKDFQDIYSLLHEFASFIKTPEKVIITPEQMILDQEYFQSIVAVDEHTIIGFATYFYAYYSWTGKAIFLDDLYVREQYRGRDIGTALFDTIIEKAKKENCTKVKWSVSNWNKNAIKFYKSRGAEVDEVELMCELII